MTYLKVQWNHTFSAEPVLLCSELDDARLEVRKVEVFRDGQTGHADRRGGSGQTRLGEEPVPPVAEIAADPQFEPVEITKEEFEDVWEQARRKWRC